MTYQKWRFVWEIKRAVEKVKVSCVEVMTQPPVKSKTACLSITNKNIKCYSLLDTNEVLKREDTTGSVDQIFRRDEDLTSND